MKQEGNKELVIWMAGEACSGREASVCKGPDMGGKYSTNVAEAEWTRGKVTGNLGHGKDSGFCSTWIRSHRRAQAADRFLRESPSMIHSQQGNQFQIFREIIQEIIMVNQTRMAIHKRGRTLVWFCLYFVFVVFVSVFCFILLLGGGGRKYPKFILQQRAQTGKTGGVSIEHVFTRHY